MAGARDEWAGEKRALLEEQDGLVTRIEEMEDRWARRESRPEDLERIAVLEKEMVDKDALVKKTREEMIYFKRELLNREENFNKKFESGGSRGMNVGVMQVLKTNNPKQPPGKPGQARPRRQSSPYRGSRRRKSFAMPRPTPTQHWICSSSAAPGEGETATSTCSLEADIARTRSKTREEPGRSNRAAKNT